MALEYGFNLYASTKEESEVAEEKFQSLSDEQKQFYHQVLPTVMMAVNVDKIDKDTVDTFIYRTNKAEMWADGDSIDLDVLDPFFGDEFAFETNIEMYSSERWEEKHKQTLELRKQYE